MRSEPDRAADAARTADRERTAGPKVLTCRLFVFVLPLLTGSVVAGLTALVRYDAGPSIGYFLVTFLFATVFAAALATASPTWLSLVQRTLGAWTGPAAVWTYDVHGGIVTGTQWAALVVLLLATLVAVVATVAGLERHGIAAPIPTAVVIATFLSWYACPIWTPDRVADGWLAKIHPALTLNGIFPYVGVWGEQPLGYQLTTLGQDVPYSLPRSIKPAICTELGWAILVVATVIVRQVLSSARRRVTRRGTEAVPTL